MERSSGHQIAILFFQICLLFSGLWEIGLQEHVHSSYSEVFLIRGFSTCNRMYSHPRNNPHFRGESWAALWWDCFWASHQLTPGCFHTLSHDRTCVCTSSLDTEEGPWHANFKLLHELHGRASPEDTNTVTLRTDDTSSHPRVHSYIAVWYPKTLGEAWPRERRHGHRVPHVVVIPACSKGPKAAGKIWGICQAI